MTLWEKWNLVGIVGLLGSLLVLLLGKDGTYYVVAGGSLVAFIAGGAFVITHPEDRA
jgi:hypothetical protein